MWSGKEHSVLISFVHFVDSCWYASFILPFYVEHGSHHLYRSIRVVSTTSRWIWISYRRRSEKSVICCAIVLIFWSIYLWHTTKWYMISYPIIKHELKESIKICHFRDGSDIYFVMITVITSFCILFTAKTRIHRIFEWKWYRYFILIIISSISIKISEFPRKSSLLSFSFEFLLSYIVILSVSFRNERLLTYINQTCACWHNCTLLFTLDDRDSRPFNSSYRRDQFSRGRGPYDMPNRSIFYSSQWIYPFSFLSLERTYNSEQGFPKYFQFFILFYIDCDFILYSKRVSDHADINRRKYKTIIPTDVCYLLVLNYCFLGRVKELWG